MSKINKQIRTTEWLMTHFPNSKSLKMDLQKLNKRKSRNKSKPSEEKEG